MSQAKRVRSDAWKEKQREKQRERDEDGRIRAREKEKLEAKQRERGVNCSPNGDGIDEDPVPEQPQSQSQSQSDDERYSQEFKISESEEADRKTAATLVPEDQRCHYHKCNWAIRTLVHNGCFFNNSTDLFREVRLGSGVWSCARRGHFGALQTAYDRVEARKVVANQDVRPT